MNQDWQPIFTAPKDGTHVLLYLGAPHNCIEKAWWFPLWKNWQTGGIPEAFDEYGGIGSACPTHWMPLPPPPNIEKSDPVAALAEIGKLIGREGQDALAQSEHLQNLAS